jgi:hypothetical protein
MSYYFDKTGNIYKIDEEKTLLKKDTIEVFNEAGEEFGLPVKIANEFKLTPDERAKVVHEITIKILELLKVIGHGGIVGGLGAQGKPPCPLFDPAVESSIEGRLAMSQQSHVLADLLRGIFGHGGGCPHVDPANLGSILGTRGFGGGCPNIDPAQIQNILGTAALQQLLGNLLYGRIGGRGCPNVDPPTLENILGSVIQLMAQGAK